MDGIGDKEGYGLGNYQLHDVDVAPKIGADFVHILSHFTAKRGARKFNSRRDVSPSELKDYLPWIALLEPIVHKEEVASRVVAALDAAAKRGQGVIGRSEERSGPPPHVRVNMLYLPLSHDGEVISHFFAYGRLDPL